MVVVYSTSQMIRLLGTVLAALLGLAFGSFLNVCLSRWPEGESVVTPRSHCRGCGRELTWWENLPLVSWIALRGRCRTCKAKISWRYPLVEAAVGLLWGIVGWRFMSEALDPHFPSALFFCDLAVKICTMFFLWLLVGLAALDGEHLWLPDWITLPGIALGLPFYALKLLLLVGLQYPDRLPFTDLLVHERYLLFGVAFKWLLGTVFAAGLILLIRWAYWLVRRREGIGLGDAKLMAMLAAWMGLPGAFLSFGLGVVLGAVFALVLLIMPNANESNAKRADGSWAVTKLPLGTFLCIGGVIGALWSQPILTAYLRWAGF
jgi:leader peptidase (prepilin peptidase)/N-methyltransferase